MKKFILTISVLSFLGLGAACNRTSTTGADNASGTRMEQQDPGMNTTNGAGPAAVDSTNSQAIPSDTNTQGAQQSSQEASHVDE